MHCNEKLNSDFSRAYLMGERRGKLRCERNHTELIQVCSSGKNVGNRENQWWNTINKRTGLASKNTRRPSAVTATKWKCDDVQGGMAAMCTIAGGLLVFSRGSADAAFGAAAPAACTSGTHANSCGAIVPSGPR